jgi:hypothetical protein
LSNSPSDNSFLPVSDNTTSEKSVDSKFAIKLFEQNEFTQLGVREFETLQKLRGHPNILNAYSLY